MWPASFAYSELTVPREIYSRAASLNSTGWEVASIVGPAIGGFVYAWRGPAVAYGTVFVLMALAMFLTATMSPRPPHSIPHPHPLPSRERESEASGEGWCDSEVWSGFRFVFSNPAMLGAISLDMFAVIFGGVSAILPIF